MVGKIKNTILVIGGLLMFIAGISPDDAQSNIAGWLNLIGIENIPAFLNTSIADNWGFTIGSLLLLFLITNWLWKRFFSVKSEYIPLWEASRTAYKHVENTPLGKIAEKVARAVPKINDRIDRKSNSSNMTMESYFASYMTANGKLPIYGSFPPAERIEQIDPNELGRGKFTDDLTGFMYWSSEEPKYTNIQVKRSELKKRLKEIKNEAHGTQ